MAKRTPPWGSAAGLLAACLATLIGVVRGIDPEVILARAAVGALVLGSIVSVTFSVARRSGRSERRSTQGGVASGK